MGPSRGLKAFTAFLLASCLAYDCEKETFRLRNQEDADALRGCSVLTGDVVIPSAAEGNINLNGVEKIVGNLLSQQCDDDCPGITSLASDNLTDITGALSLRNMTGLTTVSLQSLQTVGGNINVEGLPELTALNLTKLESAGSIYLRWNPKLANLTLPRVEFITGEESTIEMVDLAIDQWPTFIIRQTSLVPGARRLGKLLVRDLPNINRFEFNNADVIDTLEAHGLPHQKAMLQILEYNTRERARDGRADMPADVIHNLTLTGFGQNFTVTGTRANPNLKIEVTSLTIANGTMPQVSLFSVTNMTRLSVVDNPGIKVFSMPGGYDGMTPFPWERIVFRNNPHILFGDRSPPDSEGEHAGLFSLSGWRWGFNTSSLVLESNPMHFRWL
ncbi:hypothetical protein ACRALDRAFT_1070057 [Sodiomyces alcalophilus JCM 7366]|uniref:uncharacterized protein n=1 Tax=Sodiomyces alcalophilus JCM 7366 TaxID=591952 RepID=UPI0039B3A4E3